MISDPEMEKLSGLFTKMDLQQQQIYTSQPPKEIIGNEGQIIFIFNSRQCGFSNRFPAGFSLLGIHFTTMEKYFVWQKARYFADFEIAEHVLQLQNPDQIYRIGLRIRGFNIDEWNKVRDKIMYMGLWAKFTQNSQLFSQLRATGNALIAEAVHVNKYWTCGVSVIEMQRLKDPSSWDGDNKLGLLLMELRKEINECIF